MNTKFKPKKIPPYEKSWNPAVSGDADFRSRPCRGSNTGFVYPASLHFFFASSRHPAQRNLSIPILPTCTCQHTIDVNVTGRLFLKWFENTQGFIIPVKNCTKFFLPDEIIATGAPFVKHNNAFDYIWAAEGPEGSRFSVDGVAIAHSTPFKSFKRNSDWSCMTFDKHARQAKPSLCGVMVTDLAPGRNGESEVKSLNFFWYDLGKGLQATLINHAIQSTVRLCEWIAINETTCKWSQRNRQV